MKKDNAVLGKGYALALEIVKVCNELTSKKKEFVLSKQLLRCGTSVGANITEAVGGISKADFSSKMSIAYKECLETKYWLSLLKDSDLLDKGTFETNYARTDEVAKILFAILKSTRINKQ